MRLRRNGLSVAVPAAILGLALVAGPAAAPAHAQTPIDESLSKRDARRLDNMEKVVREMRDIVFKAQKTGAPVVVQPADTDARLGELTSRIDDLEHSLTRINGSLETTAHDLDQARRDNTALAAQVKALSDRLTALEQKQTAGTEAGGDAAAAGPAADGSGAPAAPQGDPAQAFAHARQLMLGGNYDGAEKAFRDYVQTFPDAPKTQEARYWWGKTLSVRGAHAEAATAYIGAIRGWPPTPWAPDAVVELARELVALKKPTDACQALAELPKRYPKATSVKARASQVATQAKCG